MTMISSYSQDFGQLALNPNHGGGAQPTFIAAHQTSRSCAGEIAFGPFRLVPAQRLLLEGETPVRVGTRAMEILIALVEKPGVLLSKKELIARVWPNTHVVDENLKFQVAALRRALGDGRDGRRYLENSPGQGYRFVARVTGGAPLAAAAARPSGSSDRHNLPSRVFPLIGRSEVVAKIAEQTSRHRLLTIVGPGGIGKTSVAIAAAEQLMGVYEDGVWRVDMAAVTDEAAVAGAVADVIGATYDPGSPLAGLMSALRNRRMLLILDNCAHVVIAVATLAAAVLRRATGVHVIATSREPLQVEGECVHLLGSLESPPASAELDGVAALRYPAVELFVERARAGIGGFELRDEDAPIVGDICRKLDGIPLVIKFAATHVGMLGVRTLAGLLEDRLRLLTIGRRTALPRHRTMRATLDWSFGLLTPAEQTVFARLSVFAGGFTLAAAAAIAADETLRGNEIVDLVLKLTTKSLVCADVDAVEPQFRLLQITRAYGLEKLIGRGEHDAIFRRHAEHYCEQIEATARSSSKRSPMIAPALDFDNHRAAMAWASGPGGDPSIALRLTAAAGPPRLATLASEPRSLVEDGGLTRRAHG